MMLETHLRQAATVLLESAIRLAPPDTREWGRAMAGELNHVEGQWAAAMWALGGAGVMVKYALASLLLPGRGGQDMVPDGGLFAKSAPLRKGALLAKSPPSGTISCPPRPGRRRDARAYFTMTPAPPSAHMAAAHWPSTWFSSPAIARPHSRVSGGARRIADSRSTVAA